MAKYYCVMDGCLGEHPSKYEFCEEANYPGNVDRLIISLRGLLANGTDCGACRMTKRIIKDALDRYYGNKAT